MAGLLPQMAAAVVGAGPAGCAAALALQAHGVERLLVLERGAPGKDKPCGDAILPDAVAALRRLGLDLESEVLPGARPFRQIDLANASGPMWRIPLVPDRGWVVPRRVLDQRVRDLACRGALIAYETTVISLTPTYGRGWTLNIRTPTGVGTVVADAVVLATGNHFARALGLDGMPNIGASRSTYLRLSGTELPRFDFLNTIPNGYGWVFPLADDWVNAGVCLVEKAHDLFLRSVRYTEAISPGATCSWRGGLGLMWSGRATRWHEDHGVVSCGDAAGLVDPLTGEGIYAALASGWAAGEAIADYVTTHGSGTLLESYSDWIRNTFRARYALSPPRRAWALLSGLPA